MEQRNKSGYATVWVAAKSSQAAPSSYLRSQNMVGKTRAVHETQECILDQVSRMSLSPQRPAAVSVAGKIVKNDATESSLVVEYQPPLPTTPLRIGLSTANEKLLPAPKLSLGSGDFRLNNEHRVLSELTGNMASSRRHRHNARRMTQRRNQGVAKKRRERTNFTTASLAEEMSTPRSVTPSLEENDETSFPTSLPLKQHRLYEKVEEEATEFQRPYFSPCCGRTVSDDALDTKAGAGCTTFCKTPNSTREKPKRSSFSIISTPASLYDEKISRLATAEDNKRKMVVEPSTTFLHGQPSDSDDSHNSSSAGLFAPSLTTPSFSIGSYDSKRSSPIRLLSRCRSNGNARLPRICYRPKRNLCATPTATISRRRIFRRSVQQEPRSNLQMRSFLSSNISDEALDNYSMGTVFRPASSPGNDMPVMPLLSPASTPAGKEPKPRVSHLDDSMLSPFATFACSVVKGDREGGCKNDVQESLNLEEMALEGLTMPVF